MKNQFQNLTEKQCYWLLKLLQKSEELFVGTFGAWKTDPVEFELKYNANIIYSKPYLLPKVHA